MSCCVWVRLAKALRLGLAPALAGAAIVSGWASPAAAAPLSATLYGLYGHTWAGGNPVDPFGPGVGLQAGIILPGSLYLGVGYQLYFGIAVGESLLSDPVIQLERVGSQNRLLGYVGYDWQLVEVTLRPSLGVGYSVETVETETSTEGQPTTERSSTARGLALSPGIEARFSLGTLSLCAELRNETLLMDGADPNAFSVGVGLGLDIDP
jgi:hypothetical protein